MKGPLHQSPDDTGTDSIGVLHELTKKLGGRVARKRVVLYGGIVLTRQLRSLYRGHKVEVLANESLVLLDLEAKYGRFELLVINPRSRSPFGKPAGTIEKASAKHTILAIEGRLSREQSELCESGALGRFLDAIAPRNEEEINVSQRLVRVYLRTPSVQRVMAVIHAVIDLMPHDKANPIQVEFATLPEALRPLGPLITKWAIEDDEERSLKLKRCAHSTRQKLAEAVIPFLPAIDKYLDGFGGDPPEEACALGTLAQAALEAQSLLSSAPVVGKPRRG